MLEHLVNPVAGIAYPNLDEDVIEKAKLCILHSLSCSYAGRHERWSTAARELEMSYGGNGNSSLWFTKYKSDAAGAAFCNAAAAQSILYEDIHRESNSHPGIIIIPVALAVAEELHVSGKQLIEAVVAGYEMMGRVGRGSVCPEFGERAFRPTSVIGIFGSAVAAGCLMGQSLKELQTAFSMSASFASGINEWANAGTDDLYFQNAMAARNGIIAARLAGKGVTAPRTIVEGRSGLCTAFGFSMEKFRELGTEPDYIIREVLFKPAPACALVQTTAQVGLDIQKSGIQADDIEEGIIHTFELGKKYSGCDYPGPFKHLLQARMSNQFNLAASVVKGKIADSNYRHHGEKDIGSLAARFKVVADDGYTQAFPKKQSVKVELKLKGGSVREFYKEEPVYLSKEDVIDRFHEFCDETLGKERVSGISDTILNLEHVMDAQDINSLFL